MSNFKLSSREQELLERKDMKGLSALLSCRLDVSFATKQQLRIEQNAGRVKDFLYLFGDNYAFTWC